MTLGDKRTEPKTRTNDTVYVTPSETSLLGL